MMNSQDNLIKGYIINEEPLTTKYEINPLLQGLMFNKELILSPLRLYQKNNIDNMLNQFVIDNNVPEKYHNALRHRGGSALMSNGLLGSPSTARYWGNIKELKDQLTRKEDDTPTDLANNELGRRLAEQYKGLSQADLLQKVYSDIQQNPQPPEYQDTPFMQSIWNLLY